jgi:hypothetical protein
MDQGDRPDGRSPHGPPSCRRVADREHRLGQVQSIERSNVHEVADPGRLPPREGSQYPDRPEHADRPVADLRTGGKRRPVGRAPAPVSDVTRPTVMVVVVTPGALAVLPVLLPDGLVLPLVAPTVVLGLEL